MIQKLGIGYVYALTCILLWSFIPIISRAGQSFLDNFQFLFWSNALSLVVVGGCTLAMVGFKPFKKLQKKTTFHIIFLGALGCAFYYLCLYYGYANGNGMEVLVLQYSWPLFIVILAAFILGERLPTKSWIAICFGFLGILIVLTKGNLLEVQFSSISVSLIVLIGAFGFALFSVLSKKLKENPLVVCSILFLGGLIVSTISLFTFSSFQLPKTEEIIPVIVNGAFINGISYIFWLKALEKIPASITAVLVFLAPVISSILIVIFFGEPFYFAYAVGMIIVVISGIICVKENIKQ